MIKSAKRDGNKEIADLINLIVFVSFSLKLPIFFLTDRIAVITWLWLICELLLRLRRKWSFAPYPSPAHGRWLSCLSLLCVFFAF